MPLEQIGASLRFFGRPKQTTFSTTPEPIEGDEIHASTSYDAHNDEEHWPRSSGMVEPAEGAYRHGYQPESMTLTKLGGVGGVQRSGSWGYNTRNPMRSPTRSTLAGRGEDWEGDEGAYGNIRDEEKPLPRRGNSTSTIKETGLTVGSYSDVASSRTSTSSSSAAAFSLRSLSNRNSVSSNGSSASSSVRRLTSDEGHAPSTTTVGRTTSMRRVQGLVEEEESERRGAQSSDDGFEQTVRRSGSMNKALDDSHPPSSNVGPSVQRIQSIGRGFDVRKSSIAAPKTRAEEKSEATTTQSAGEGTRQSITEPATTGEPSMEAGAAGISFHLEDDTKADLSTTSLPASTADDTIASLRRPLLRSSGSYEDAPYQPKRLSHSPSTSALGTDVKARLNSLKLTDVAQAELTSEDMPSFVPPQPRRHTGSYALRSRSALSQTLGSGALQFSSGHGRAAARRELARSTGNTAHVGGRSDHLSALATPRFSASREVPASQDVLDTTSSRSDVLSWRATALALTSVSPHSANGALDFVSPRTVPIELVSESTMPTSSGGHQTGGGLGLHTLGGGSARSSLMPPSMLDLVDAQFSPNALASPDGSFLGISPSTRFLDEERNASSAAASEHSEDNTGGSVAVLGMRPGFGRSSTALSGLNVLRTPTTEEWSRYLIRQGLDPATIAAAAGTSTHGGQKMISAGSTSFDAMRARPRSNTSRSTVGTTPHAAARRRVSEWDEKTSSVSSSTEGLDNATPTVQQPSTSLFSANDVILAEALRQRLQGRAQRPSVGSSLREGIGAGEPSGDVLNAEDEMELLDDDVIGSPRAMDEEEEMASQLDSFSEMLSRSDDEVDDDEDLPDGIDERLRALHAAISRPPSPRRATPAPSESGMDRSTDNLEALKDHTDPRRNPRWPWRETAAALTGYSMPPTGEQWSINDFAIVDDIGRGAYGLVKKVRMRDPITRQPVGPEFAIKYIIKSRILADCWRRHKALGPIPVEIHVLDQLRRLAYPLPREPQPWSAAKLFGCPPYRPAASAQLNNQEEGEASIVTVGHPSLCVMVDFFEDHEFYYMVMPRFGIGQDLFDYVESQPHGLTTRHVRCIFGQLADGLRFLHANNIVHRDVKDENVILDGQGHIQLIDFGSAAHILTRANSGEHRLFDTFSGTLDYAAAEILRGEKYGGKEQDVWALGVVGYVLLCGDCPFWNGEEAMEGLCEGSRALQVLHERQRALDEIETDANTSGDDHSIASTAPKAVVDEDGMLMDSFSGRPILSPPLTPTGERHDPGISIDRETLAEVARRKEDRRGQADQGGCLDDAADLIMRCLELDPMARPTMEQICRHRFLIGQGGWHGPLGWQNGVPETMQT